MTTESRTYLVEAIRTRHSQRVSFDPERAPSQSDLREILEAGGFPVG